MVAIVAVALMIAAAGTARAALSTGGPDAAMPARPAARPRRPFLIMNPRSGGKVTRFGLKDKAEALGAEVALLQGPGTVDVAALARKAVADGADLLGVVGGDGTQALVAGIAAEHGLPFLVISAGTRNHFALDLGGPRHRPRTEALSQCAVGPPAARVLSARPILAPPGHGKHRRRAQAGSKITEAGEADSMRSFWAVRR